MHKPDRTTTVWRYRCALIGAVMAVLFSCGAAAPIGAVELWPRDAAPAAAADAPAANQNAPATVPAGPHWVITLNTTLKLSGLAATNPADRLLFPQPNTALGLFRLRFDLKATYGEIANFDLAYDHSAQWSSYDRGAGGFGGLAGAGGSGLGSGAGGVNRLPFRVTPLSDRLVDEDRVVWTHELDRLLLAWHPKWGEITVGRQAIGLGRGVLFSAVDLFAPFAALAVDREWRPGVDAARVEARLTDRSSVEAILVGGESWAQSAGLLRARGYVGKADAELLFGIRTEQPFVGVVVSSAVRDAELHGEIAMFRLPHDHPDGEPFGNNRVATKAVLGSSYTFNIGDGLSLVGEYFYNGLGATDATRVGRLLATSDFALRYRLGDLPILTRHAIGLQASYPFTATVTGSANLVLSPRDGSGVLSPTARWDVNDSVSLTASAFLPWGARSRTGVLQSEYGSTPVSLFGQLGWYL